MVKTTANNDTIFIIDDDPVNIKVLEAMLVELNYSVRVAVQGPIAIKSIKQAPPDLILLDVKMPDMDGYEVCKKLRNSQITKDIPIIFLSALDEIEAKVKALNAGGNDYITKPFQFEEISARIQTHLSIRKLQQKLESKNFELSQEISERKQAEVQISMLSQALKESPSNFIITDITGNIEFVNPSFTKLTGYTLEELTGQSTRILQSGKTITEEYKRMWEAITTGGTWKGELCNKKKNGELYWESASISSMKNSDGVITNFIKVAEDITERKKRDAERLRLSQILELTSDFVSSATKDADIIYINKSGKEMIGWEDDIKHNPKKIKDAHPEWALRIIENEGIPSALKNGVWEGETALIKNDRTEIPVSQVIMSHKLPEGDIEYISTIMRDITVRKQTEEELYKKNSYLRLLQVAAVAANEAKDIKEAFQPILEQICCFTGWEIGHAYLISKNDPDLLTPTNIWYLEEQNRFMDFCTITKKSDFTRGVGFTGMVLESRKPRWIMDVTKDKDFIRRKVAKALGIKSGIAFPVMIGNQVVAVLEFFTTSEVAPDLQFMEIMADVGTQLGRVVERKNMEEALLHAEKMKAMGIMTTGVAHEFNNMLAVISSNAQLLEETHAGDNELMYALSTICRMSDDGAKIVSKMYEFTNTQKDTSHHTNIDLHDLVNQVIDFTMPRWKKMAQARGINYQIVWDAARDLSSVVGNPSELREVVLNIINNALDAMPAGGIITVGTRNVDEESKIKNKKNLDTKIPKDKKKFVEISFTDTGKGMTEEVKKMIFDPFFTTRGPEGTGLGMSVSYGIIIRHGGQISVESEFGKGSVINMRLPVAGTPSQHAVTSRQDSKLDTRSLSVLVVDDEIEMCEVLCKFFFNEGHKVRGVNNGVQAIELLNENNYDLLICDLVMPEVNGRDVVNSLKEMNKRPKVGLITGWKFSMKDAEKEGLQVDFITRKPFDMYNLRKDISDLWN